MNLYSFSVLNFSFGTLLTGILVLAKRKDEIASRFFLFSMIVCGWGYLFSLWISQLYSEEVTLMLIRMSYVFVVFIPVTWFNFILEFIQNKEPHRLFYISNIAATVICALACPTLLMFNGTHSLLEFKYLPTPGIAHHLHALQFFTLVPIGFYLLIQNYLNSSGGKKEQVKYFIIATTIGFVGGGSIYLPFYKIPFPLYLVILMPLYPIFMAFALMRHGLFNVQQIADAAHRDKLAAIGTLATSINHEIRNPLYIIQGLSDSYLANIAEGIYKTDEEKSRKSQEIFRKTSQQATRAMEIMKSFAMFAKQNVNEHFKAEAVNISELLNGILPLVNHELELEKIKLIREIPEKIYVNADRRHLEEILFNLIVNASQALKHSSKKTPQITIRSESKNQIVHLEVRDNGPGIPQGQLSKVFEPFYTTKEEGTGLGLYVTRQLVEKNRGKIEIESRPGEGTSFILSFPVDKTVKNRT